MRSSLLSLTVIAAMTLSACSSGGGKPPPTPPRANAGAITLDEDTDGAGTMTGVAGEGGALSFSVQTQPSDGTLAVSGASFTYTPNADFNGSDSFSFIVTEGSLSSSPATFTLNVTPVNDDPVSSDSTLATDEDIPLQDDVTASDVDGDTLTLTVATQTTNGVVTPGVGTAFTYQPDQDFFGQDSFTFTISDGTVSTAAATVTIDVASINDAPVVSNITDTVTAGTPETYDLTGTDVENDALTYTVTAAFAKSTVTNDPTNSGMLDVTPDYGQWGADTATYVANDGQVDSAPAMIDLDIEVPVTTGFIAVETYDSGSQATPLGVVEGVPDRLYLLGNVFGDFVPASGNTTEQQFIAIYDAAGGARVTELYLGGASVGDAAMGYVSDRFVAAGSTVNVPSNVRVMSLDTNDAVDVDVEVALPYAIVRAFQNFETVHVPDVGFFVLANDNQLSFIDYTGTVQSTTAIPSPLSTIVNQYRVQDVRVIGNTVYMAGLILECGDASDQCFSGIGAMGFLLTATTVGAPQQIVQTTTGSAIDSIILDDGRVAQQRQETLLLYDTSGNEVWQRSAPGATQVVDGHVSLDAGGDLYWFSFDRATDNIHLERVTTDNATVWQTDQLAALVDFFWPTDMSVDQYGNVFLSYVDRYNSMGAAFGRVVNMHFDYSGTHQWTEISEPSDMAPRADSSARTVLGVNYRFVTVGGDNINAGGADSDVFLFINTVTPTPP